MLNDRARVQELEQQSRDLAMLIRSLVYRLRRRGNQNDGKACDLAVDYLRRKGLEGSVLRKSGGPK